MMTLYRSAPFVACILWLAPLAAVAQQGASPSMPRVLPAIDRARSNDHAMSAEAALNIARKIVDQVKPCASRQLPSGPGAERIRVILRLRLNRDGSLIGDPEILGYDGVDDGNRPYLDRVKANAIATFKNCAPLRDLPQEYYDVPRGWSDFRIRYKLPG